jgi:hypothetical protein
MVRDLTDMTDTELVSRRDALRWDLRADPDLRGALADVENELERRRDAAVTGSPVSATGEKLGTDHDRTGVRGLQGRRGAARPREGREP